MPLYGTWRITKEDWLGGIAINDRLAKPTQYSKQSIAIHPHRSLGGLMPGFNPVEVTGIAAMPRSWVPGNKSGSLDDYNNVYMMDNGRRVYQITGSSPANALHTFPASPVGNLYTYMEQYTISGTNYLLCNYGTDIGRSPADWASGAGWTDAYWTATLGQAALSDNMIHPMKVFLGKLYIADKNQLHELNNTTVTVNRITLPDDQIITKLEVWRDQLVILTNTRGAGTARRGNPRIYLWNGSSSTYNSVFDIAANMVHDMLNINGILYFVPSYNYHSLAYFDGGTIQPIIPFPPIAFGHVQNTIFPTPQVLGFAANTIFYFAPVSATAAVVYTFDSPYRLSEPALHAPFYISGSAGFEIGTVYVDGYDSVYIGFYDGAAYRVYYFNSQVRNNSDFVTTMHTGGTTSKKEYRNFRFYFGALASGEGLQFAYAVDGGAFTNFTAGNPTFAANGAETFWRIDQPIQAHELQIRVRFSTGSAGPTFYGMESDWREIPE